MHLKNSHIHLRVKHFRCSQQTKLEVPGSPRSDGTTALGHLAALHWEKKGGGVLPGAAVAYAFHCPSHLAPLPITPGPTAGPVTITNPSPPAQPSLCGSWPLSHTLHILLPSPLPSFSVSNSFPALAAPCPASGTANLNPYLVPSITEDIFWQNQSCRSDISTIFRRPSERGLC